MNAKATAEANGMPDTKASVKQLFGFDTNMEVQDLGACSGP